MLQFERKRQLHWTLTFLGAESLCDFVMFVLGFGVEVRGLGRHPHKTCLVEVAHMNHAAHFLCFLICYAAGCGKTCDAHARLDAKAFLKELSKVSVNRRK